MPQAISINDIAPAARASAWRDAVCNTFVRLECGMDRRAPMHGRIESGSVGELRVARVQSSPQQVERTRQSAAQANEAFVLLSVQLRGRTIVKQGEQEALLTPGCIAFYDTARPYTLTLPADFEQIVLHLPRHTVQALCPNGLDHMAERVNAADPFAQAILALAPQLLRLVTVAPSALADRTAAAVVELISLALSSLALPAESARVVAPLKPSLTATSSAAIDALIWRVRELISRQIDDAQLSPGRLAQQVNVPLRRLQEVFKSRDSSLADCIWQMRLEFARSLLACVQHRHASISTLAYRAGFSDVAHFSRRFRLQFGVSPSQYRLAAL